MIQLWQRVGKWLVVFSTMAEHIQSQINRLAEGTFVGYVFTCYLIRRTMIRRCAHNRQSGGEVYAFATIESLERSKALIMVHGKHAVERLITATGEKTVSRIRTESIYAFFRKLLDRRSDNLLLLCAKQTAIAGMGIERKYCYAWVGNAEVTLQRPVENLSFLNYVFFCYCLRNIFYLQMCCNKGHTHNIIE